MRQLRLQFILRFLSFHQAVCGDWAQFRGPNASGLAIRGICLSNRPQKTSFENTLPAGHPRLNAGDRIFLTGYDEQNMLIFGLIAATAVCGVARLRARVKRNYTANSPASRAR
jgi:hypothetical protein